MKQGKQLLSLLLCVFLLLAAAPAALADGLRLADCATDNIVRAEEVTFLGHPLSTVKQADMDGILLENGFEKSPGSSSEYACYSKVIGDGASYTGYAVYPNAENGASVLVYTWMVPTGRPGLESEISP